MATEATPNPMNQSGAPVMGPGHTLGTVTDKISAIVLQRRTPLGWWIGFGIGFALLQLLFLTIGQLLFVGTGSGVTIPIGWG
jgi:molybdopterin-containing oxidoreductase family membrane subunit